MWCDHPFNQRNKKIERALGAGGGGGGGWDWSRVDREGKGGGGGWTRLEKRGVGNIVAVFVK